MSTPGPTRDRSLGSLTGLRALAAAAVFGRHVWGRLSGTALGPVVDHLLRQGANGVSFFFVLSGFVLAWSFRPDDPARRWAGRRAARILPLHVVTWAAAFGVVALEGGHVTIGIAVANLLLVHAFVPNVAVYYSLNAVSWSLSCEAFFYVLFRPLHRVFGFVGSRWVVPLMALGVVANLSVLGAVRVVGPTHAAWWGYISPLFRVIEFALGMLLARAVVEERWPRVPFGVAFALAAGAYVASGYASFPFVATGITLVPFIVLVGAAAHADLAGRRTLWSSNAARRLGEWSFAFYLVHQLVIRVADHEDLGRGAGAFGQSCWIVVLLGASVALAAALHQMIERPVVNAARRRERSAPAGA